MLREIVNYQKELDKTIAEILSSGEKRTLLLHACCGPCSSYVLEYLVKYFEITVLYYNPNIYPPEEYQRRLFELKDLYAKFPPVLEGNVKVIEDSYNQEDFYKAVGTREQPELAVEPEKGERCRRCYEFRIRRAFNYAAQNKFDYFCTTLSISPFKDSDKINKIGKELSQLQNASDSKTPIWLYSDFKKKNGFKRSLEISKEYDLYRQDYCGCIYSQNNMIR